MNDVTLLLPKPPSPEAKRDTAASLPPDLLAQVRGRVRLLAGLILLAAAVDPLVFIAGWVPAATRWR